jgi:hypothetical protein
MVSSFQVRSKRGKNGGSVIIRVKGAGGRGEGEGKGEEGSQVQRAGGIRLPTVVSMYQHQQGGSINARHIQGWALVSVY